MSKYLLFGVYLIVIYEMIFWLAEHLGFKVSHQTITAVKMLEEFEKTEMYFQIGKELIEKRNVESIDGKMNVILRNIIRPFVSKYIGDDNDFLINLSSDEIELANAYVYIREGFCKYVRDTIEQKFMFTSEIRKNKSIIRDQQLEIEGLYKKIALLQHQIDRINREDNREIAQIQNQLKLLQNELFSLREFIFSKQYSNESIIKVEKSVYKGDYREVVIIGGHCKWQRKVTEQLKGINVVSTDQNVVDWSFLNNIKIVVIVTNYISHSMYNRVINKVISQKLVYIDSRNVDQLELKLNQLLI